MVVVEVWWEGVRRARPHAELRRDWRAKRARVYPLVFYVYGFDSSSHFVVGVELHTYFRFTREAC